ncbi:hypothetical protein [Mycobacterium sp.]|uniref:hypothetical protein n=1 Tax=Mycobacterium sp. TaxID=1785 RepID=UPI00126BCC19|nr:hypothetical protein [Mycobacterium sp.]KAA8966030.1 MAG: hypothetical protein F6Q13_07930 [Mycobacterium sp.]
MFALLRSRVLAGAACTALALNGCGGSHVNLGLLSAIISPTIPVTTQDVPGPLRGQYEDLLQPLFPQGNPADRKYPPWPASYDASMRVSWRQLQPTDPRTLPADTPDDRKYDFSVIDEALRTAAQRNMRLMLRVYAYNSCCDASYPNNTNIAIPDWMRHAATSYSGPKRPGQALGVIQVVPNWNDPAYLNGFSQLLAALGRRYDRDERLSVFEFSGYGDFSEDHIAYLRDALGAPGPAPEHSIAKLGYYSQFRDQSITIDSIRRLVAANVDAFPHTQLVVNPPNPEIVRQLLADDVTKKLSAPVGIRSDCLGVYAPLPAWAESAGSYYVYSKDPLVEKLKDRLASAPVITEWCQLPAGTSPRSYYEKGLHDVVRYHVSMTSSYNFPDRVSNVPMPRDVYLLWAQANVLAGYRYSVQARQRTQSLRDGVAKISVDWTNYGSAVATEQWVPSYQLVDFSGEVIRTLPSAVVLKTLLPHCCNAHSDTPAPASATESVAVDLRGLAPGHYIVRALVEWRQHKPGGVDVVNYPPLRLARDGRDASGGYPIATLDIPRDTVSL